MNKLALLLLLFSGLWSANVLSNVQAVEQLPASAIEESESEEMELDILELFDGSDFNFTTFYEQFLAENNTDNYEAEASSTTEKNTTPKYSADELGFIRRQRIEEIHNKEQATETVIEEHIEIGGEEELNSDKETEQNLDNFPLSRRPRVVPLMIYRTVTSVRKAVAIIRKYKRKVMKMYEYYQRYKMMGAQIQQYRASLKAKVDYWLMKWNRTKTLTKAFFQKQKQRLTRFIHSKQRRLSINMTLASETVERAQDGVSLNFERSSTPPLRRVFEFTHVQLVCPGINIRQDEVLFFNGGLPLTPSFYVKLSSEKKLTLDPAWSYDTGVYSCYVNDQLRGHISLEVIPVEEAVKSGLLYYSMTFSAVLVMIAFPILVRGCCVWRNTQRRIREQTGREPFVGARAREVTTEDHEPKQNEEDLDKSKRLHMFFMGLMTADVGPPLNRKFRAEVESSRFQGPSTSRAKPAEKGIEMRQLSDPVTQTGKKLRKRHNTE